MEYYYCPKCDTLYDASYLKTNEERGQYYIHCPNADCYGKAFEIDELMIIPIKLLNQKGYKTRFCCSGHISDKIGGGYVAFRPNIDIPSLPKGWKKDKQGLNDGSQCIRYDMKTTDILKRYNIIQTKMRALIRWCNELPPLE